MTDAQQIGRGASLTRSGDAAVERHVAGQIRDIADSVVRTLGRRLRALWLVGGFGRGEGSAYHDEAGPHVVNDYDLVVVLDNGTLTGFLASQREVRPILNRLSEELAERLSVKQVDFGLTCPALLRHARRTIANVDIREGTVVLAGTQEPADLMPILDPTRIDPTEGTKLLLNRGGGLLIAAIYASAGHPLTSRQRRNVMIEIDKAWIAIGDAILVSQGAYHVSYEERLKRIETVRPIPVAMSRVAIRHYQDAVTRKLEPQPGAVTADLDLVKREFLRHFLEYERWRTGVSFEGWLDYADGIASRRYPLGRRLLEAARSALTIRGGNDLSFSSWLTTLWLGKELFLAAQVPLLLESHERKGQAEAVRYSAQMMGLNIDSVPAEEGWLSTARRFMRIWHPTGEAGRVANGANE